jgi:nucleoid DNA-binding protein
MGNTGSIHLQALDIINHVETMAPLVRAGLAQRMRVRLAEFAEAESNHQKAKRARRYAACR